MDERRRRLALNEALFRDVNERIHDATKEYPGLSVNGTQDYVCECSNADCTFHIRLSDEQYEHIRASGKTFVVAPEHYLPEIEDVVEKSARYWVVAKREDTGEYVALLDPRRD